MDTDEFINVLCLKPQVLLFAGNCITPELEENGGGDLRPWKTTNHSKWPSLTANNTHINTHFILYVSLISEHAKPGGRSCWVQAASVKENFLLYSIADCICNLDCFLELLSNNCTIVLISAYTFNYILNYSL